MLTHRHTATFQWFLTVIKEENSKKRLIPEDDIATMFSALPQIHMLHSTKVVPRIQTQSER